jgi:hypothetical protein
VAAACSRPFLCSSPSLVSIIETGSPESPLLNNIDDDEVA